MTGSMDGAGGSPLGRFGGLVALLGAGLVSMAAPDRCEVCGGTFGETIYSRTDHWTLEKRSFCETCRTLEEICAICQIPVKRNFTAVGDGRFLCERDVKLVILDDAQAMQVLQEARADLDRNFVRFTTLPSTNTDLAFETQVHMEQLLRSPGFERQCPLIYGFTRSLLMHDRGWRHEIRILRGLARSEMIATYVHELGHAWMKENVPPVRLLAQPAAEGFCELLAFRLLEHLGETHQIARLRRNGYTQGQIDLFLKVYDVYDLNPILEWMKYGRDPYLREADLDRVRMVDLPSQPGILALPPVDPSRVVRAPAPETLTLLGILGTGPRCAALVNDGLLSRGETATVRLGTNSIAVHCLEIGTNSVVLERLDTGEQVQLQLVGKAPVPARGASP